MEVATVIWPLRWPESPSGALTGSIDMETVMGGDCASAARGCESSARAKAAIERAMDSLNAFGARPGRRRAKSRHGRVAWRGVAWRGVAWRGVACSLSLQSACPCQGLFVPSLRKMFRCSCFLAGMVLRGYSRYAPEYYTTELRRGHAKTGAINGRFPKRRPMRFEHSSHSRKCGNQPVMGIRLGMESRPL